MWSITFFQNFPIKTLWTYYVLVTYDNILHPFQSPTLLIFYILDRVLNDMDCPHVQTWYVNFLCGGAGSSEKWLSHQGKGSALLYKTDRNFISKTHNISYLVKEKWNGNVPISSKNTELSRSDVTFQGCGGSANKWRKVNGGGGSVNTKVTTLNKSYYIAVIAQHKRVIGRWGSQPKVIVGRGCQPYFVYKCHDTCQYGSIRYK